MAGTTLHVLTAVSLGTLMFAACGTLGPATPLPLSISGAVARPAEDGLVASHMAGFTFSAPAQPPGPGGAATLLVTDGSGVVGQVSVVSSRRADLEVLRNGRPVYRWSQGRMFKPIAYTETWEPGATRPFTLTGLPAFPPGTYTARFFFFGLPGGTAQAVLVTRWTVGSP